MTAASWDELYAATAMPCWGANAVPAIDIVKMLCVRQAPRQIIDCGCGDGRNLMQIAGMAPVVIGADISAVALARAHTILKETPAVLLYDDVCASRFVDGSFDCVVALEVLSHIPRVEVALAEMRRICAPGGYIIGDVFGVRDATRDVNARCISSGLYVDDRDLYYSYYDRDALLGVLRSIDGCVLNSIKLLSWDDPPHGQFRPYPHRHEAWCFVLHRRRDRDL